MRLKSLFALFFALSFGLLLSSCTPGVYVGASAGYPYGYGGYGYGGYGYGYGPRYYGPRAYGPGYYAPPVRMQAAPFRGGGPGPGFRGGNGGFRGGARAGGFHGGGRGGR